MISARPIPFSAARPLGEEFKTSGGVAFYLHAPSGAPPDLSFTTDEQSHIKVPIQPGIVYTFPQSFSSVWLFHANAHVATDAQLVFATGQGELIPGGQSAYAGSAGAALYAQGIVLVSGTTTVGPACAAGKRQRLLSLTLSVPGDSVLTAAGEVTCAFQMQGGTPAGAVTGPRVAVPAAAGTASMLLGPITYNFGPQGILGQVAGRLQSILATTGTLPFTAGGVVWEMAYTEE